MLDEPQFRSAQVMIACHDIGAALAFYVERLGFRVDSIFPAESPTVAVLRGYGIRLRLDPQATSAVTLRLLCDEPDRIAEGPLVAPDGTIVELFDANPPLVLPPIQQSFVLQRAADDASWTVGRAGMRYRDLIPDRQGGRFVGSHIVIPDAGPVPDYVHFHNVRFQMIYCYRGWVRLVYEDQGEPFIMRAGDCVLQPPQIRHRVLESSAGLEVIELGCPALHETFADPELPLPNAVVNPSREFSGQRFVFHQAQGATWEPSPGGFETRRFGLREATDGLAEASVLRTTDLDAPGEMWSHNREFEFLFVLDGSVALRHGDETSTLMIGDNVVVPAGMRYSLVDASADLQMLQVALPG